jgi:hypothetical protein
MHNAMGVGKLLWHVSRLKEECKACRPRHARTNMQVEQR